MTADRQPGSDRGRPAIDWEQAFHHYASLPAEERSYRTVADYYEISGRTVEKHGARERWRERARQIDHEAACSAAKQLADERARALIDMTKLAQASLVAYGQQLQDGTVRMSPSDLRRVHDLLKELWDDREAPTPPTEPRQQQAQSNPSQHKLQVLRALHDAGALGAALGLVEDDTRGQPHERGETDEDESVAPDQTRASKGAATCRRVEPGR